MKILFVASEARPFIASGGLADVAGSLPKALCDLGHECRVVIPLYKNIPQQFREKMEFVRNFNVPLAWRNQYCGVFKIRHQGVVTISWITNIILNAITCTDIMMMQSVLRSSPRQQWR